MIYTRIKDKRLYPNTVIFQTTDGKGVTYYNASVLEQIRTEISAILTNSYDEGVKEKALQIIDKYREEQTDAT